MRTPHPDPRIEAWLKRQLANRPPLSAEQRRHIAALLAAERADRARQQIHAADLKESA